MRSVKFFKYEGSGNDFIMIDNRSAWLNLSTEEIIYLCDRHKGIGGDGLIFLESCQDYDYRMRFFNPDGSEADMCGNGARCTTLLAHHVGIITLKKKFLAKDGKHIGIVSPINNSSANVKIQMQDISEIRQIDSSTVFLNSGVPHYVTFVDDINSIDINAEAPKIRYSEEFSSSNGTNVNYVSVKDGALHIRTYERGVEGETLSCGTGACASAVAYHYLGLSNNLTQTIITKGGDLNIEFDGKYENVYLSGESSRVYEGRIFMSKR